MDRKGLLFVLCIRTKKPFEVIAARAKAIIAPMTTPIPKRGVALLL
jgi:hypothetical protein